MCFPKNKTISDMNITWRHLTAPLDALAPASKDQVRWHVRPWTLSGDRDVSLVDTSVVKMIVDGKPLPIAVKISISHAASFCILGDFSSCLKPSKGTHKKIKKCTPDDFASNLQFRAFNDVSRFRI